MKLQSNDGSYYRPLPQIMNVHLYDESLELVSDDELDNQSLPEFINIHLQHRPHHSDAQQHYHEKPLNEMMKLDSNPTTRNLTLEQIRNRKINRRHQANRDRYEVVRRVYPLFNITDVKQILKSMNIFNVNINMVRDALFIGLKIQETVNEVEQLLHNRIFTEQRYNQLYEK